ncbi:hypothetical protein [Jatrophihabitans sp. GAS493]|uniref:hypothetical protein n=1 Tax=Jatrophihabitans sp. GAS493 TaxID=1907575 RepID=UPI001560610F|nr:hypothetical protein [Jatrophihabitans sp. GAS493]
MGSPNGAYTATMQTDGNFVVYAGTKALWSTHTKATNASLSMQTDGNLVIYNAGKALWSTHTTGTSATLTIQNDGNLVIYVAGKALWSWRTGLIAPPTPASLTAGHTLPRGGSLLSPNHAYRTTIQTDGNFVVYAGTKALWSTHTKATNASLSMQTDGNLVIYNAGKALWSTHTTGTSATLTIQNDGNLVIYVAGKALWSWRTGLIAPPTPASLTAGHTLPRGGSLLSPNHAYRTTIQTDGNFVVYAGTKALWSSHTKATNASLSMQTDGNLVIYNAGKALWSTHTTGTSATLTIQNDGNLVIYVAGKALWSWRTGLIPPPVLTAKPLASAAIVYTDETTIVVAWLLRTGVTSGQVMVRRAVGAVAPTSPTSGTLIGDVTATEGYVTDTSVAHNVTYSYALFPHDASGYAARSTVTGTTALSWNQTATMYPDNYNDISCPSTTLCVGVDTKGSAATTTDNGVTWSTPVQVDSNDGGLSSVSCATTTFCVAVDFYGNAFIYNGTNWSGAQDIDGDNAISSVSCPTTTFCQVVDFNSNAVVYHSGTWSSPTLISANKSFITVSCATASFCAAVDYTGDATIYNGSAWGTLKNIDGTHRVTTVSCTTDLFCAAVDDSGNAIIYKSGQWGQVTDVEGPSRPNYEIYEVSCKSSTFCVGIDFDGSPYDSSTAWAFNGTTWTNAGSGLTLDGATTIDCASTTSCIASDYKGHTATYNGASWSAAHLAWMPSAPQRGVTDISCSSAAFCMAVDDTTTAYTFVNGHLDGSTTAPTADGLTSVSCKSATFCLAITGTISSPMSTIYNGSTWSTPVSVGNTSDDSVSCVSTSFCVAAGPNQTDIRVFNGSSWANVPGYTGSPVSCVSSTFCATVTSGDVGFYIDGTWYGGNVDGSNLTGISCASATFCVAVDQEGNALAFNGDSWSSQEVTGDQSVALVSVSCASTTFCSAVDGSGAVYGFNGTYWVSYADVSYGLTVKAISCPSPTFCAMADTAGNFYIGN